MKRDLKEACRREECREVGCSHLGISLELCCVEKRIVLANGCKNGIFSGERKVDLEGV